jgi:alpha-beta hydrolase superfamily lysophospholipase
MITTDHTPALSTFTSHDGAALHYRHWPAERRSGRAVLLFHRGHEHSGRWQETVEALGLADVDVFAGMRAGMERRRRRGSAEHIGVLIRDVDCFVRHVQETHGIAMQEMIIVAHSVGAVVATAWVHDYAPPIRGLVLATPAFRVRLYVPGAVPLLRVRQKLFGGGYVKSYVKARLLTHDDEQARLYTEDPAVFPQIAVNLLLDLHDTGARLVEDAAAIRVPLLMLTAGAIGSSIMTVQRTFFDRVGSADKTRHVLPGFHHAIFMKKSARSLWSTCGSSSRVSSPRHAQSCRA